MKQILKSIVLNEFALVGYLLLLSLGTARFFVQVLGWHFEGLDASQSILLYTIVSGVVLSLLVGIPVALLNMTKNLTKTRA